GKCRQPPDCPRIVMVDCRDHKRHIEHTERQRIRAREVCQESQATGTVDGNPQPPVRRARRLHAALLVLFSCNRITPADAESEQGRPYPRRCKGWSCDPSASHRRQALGQQRGTREKIVYCHCFPWVVAAILVANKYHAHWHAGGGKGRGVM